MKRKGFTLIELLIVVVVIVTLMGIVFRLAGFGSSSRARATTIARMQKLENALSGYYAAYGSYPPVPLHASRDVYLRANSSRGIQNPGERDSELKWANVKAACLAQPVAVRYPIDRAKDAWHESMLQYIQVMSAEWNNPRFPSSLNTLQSGTGSIGSRLKYSDWRDCQLFEFGVMSFLLPRYLFMLGGDEGYYTEPGGQWDVNNSLHQVFYLANGQPYPSWKAVQKAAGQGDAGKNAQSSDLANIRALPTQAVCARWMQNFAGICASMFPHEFYGVNIRLPNGGGVSDQNSDGESAIIRSVFGAGDSNSSSLSNPYLLDFITVVDGWGNDFYYYCPPPYQSYVLWSSGPDGKTFPPWVDLGSLTDSDRRNARQWASDDIKHLNN